MDNVKISKHDLIIENYNLRLFEQISDLFVYLSPDLKILKVNLPLVEVYGKSIEEYIGASYDILFKDCKLNVRLKDSKNLIAELKKKYPVSLTETTFVGDLKIVWKMNAVLSKSGKLDGVVLIGKKFNEISLMEKKANDARFSLETMIAYLPGNVYWMDKNCIHLGCNNNVLNMLGMTREEYIGKTYEELSKIVGWTHGEGESFKKDDLEVLKTGVPKFNVEEPPIRHVDGSVYYYLTTRVPMKNEAGEIVGVAGISIDITERKKMEEELQKAKEAAEAANRAKSEFIANMSHDIRTPLAGIIGISKILELNSKNLEIQDQLHSIFDCSNQLLDLLDGVLTIISTDQLRGDDVQEKTFDLHNSIQNLKRLEMPIATVKNIDLHFDIDENVPRYVMSDRIKLERILLNLLANAIKFTKEGYVELKVKQSAVVKNNKAKIEFIIKDTGIGIAEEHQQKVFDRFFRANPSYKGEYEGHGIGLYVVQKFVKLLGGKISMSSREGEGTTFYFTIPMKLGNESDVKSSKPTHGIIEQLENKSLSMMETSLVTQNDAKEFSGDRPLVLLVEDNIVALKISSSILTQLGCVVKIAKDGESALQVIKTMPVDLVLTDIGLPGISGDELTVLIRYWEKSQDKKPVPIIGLTAHAAESLQKEKMNAGLNAVYSKPISLESVKTMLDKYVGNHGNYSVTTEEKAHSADEEGLFNLNPYVTFDLQESLKIIGNESSSKEVLELMVKQALSEDEQVLNIAYHSGDWAAVQRLTHKLKGGALYCGAIKLQQACQRLETYLMSGGGPLADKLHQQLIHVLAETKRAIGKWLESQAN